MKKKTLVASTLVLYLLVVCTLLSAWVEREMMPSVEVKTLQYKGVSLSFSPNVLFLDEEGEHFYNAVIGAGWESGLRAREIASTQYNYDMYGQIAFYGSPQTYRFIMSASRQPVAGEKVFIVEQFDEVEDVHLYCYPDGVPEEVWLPWQASLVSQSDCALLIRNTRARLPFFQHTAKTLSVAASQAAQAYSLTEVQDFIGELPALALLLLTVVFGFVFWGLACLHHRNRRLLLANTLALLACTALMAALLNRLDLPACMLPATNLFDLPHYAATLGTILSALSSCGETSVQLALQQTGNLCIAALLAGLPVMAAVLLIEKHTATRC